MNYRLIVDSNLGSWVFDVFLHKEELARVCNEKGWPADFDNPQIDDMNAWQHAVFDEADEHTFEVAAAEGKTGLVWATNTPTQFVRMPDTGPLDSPKIKKRGFELKLVNKPT